MHVIDYAFYACAAISIIAAAWLLLSRSTFALRLTVAGLAGVLLYTAFATFMLWRVTQPNGMIDFLEEYWEPVTIRFLLPLTASISASTIALCIHWRRKRKVHDAA